MQRAYWCAYTSRCHYIAYPSYSGYCFCHFDIEVACQPSQRQKHVARTEGQSRLDAPSQPFSAMITDGSDSCITIKLIFIRCRMPHTLCILDFGKRYPIIIKWRDAESRLAMQHQARSTTLSQPQGRSTKSQTWCQVDFITLFGSYSSSS